MGLKYAALVGLTLNLLVILLLSWTEPLPYPQTRRKAWQVYERSPKTPYYASPAWFEYLAQANFLDDHQKISRQNDYCELTAQYQGDHPLELSSTGRLSKASRVVYTDYPRGNLVRDVISEVAVKTMKDHALRTDEALTDWAVLDPAIRLFLHKTPGWHLRHRIGTEFLCEGQRYNHIPGHEHIVNKDEFARIAFEYGQHFADRPECFQVWEFMPLTYDLHREADCTEFARLLEEDSDLKRIKWIRKKSRNSHNAEGVSIVDEALHHTLMAKYSKQCPEKKRFIVQKYIADPLLVEGRKFDFRIYMLVASVEPLVVLYHDGFLRVSLADFDNYSQEAYAHITNTALAKDYARHRDDEEELLDDQMWTMEEFEAYMIGQGLVSEGWLGAYVRPYMRRAMLHIARMAYPVLMHHPGVFELFGVDFMFDSQLHLWFLEINRSPSMQATTEEKGRLQRDVIAHMIDIEFALLTGQRVDEAIEESGFEWVYDGRRGDMSQYHGLLEESCL
jgi:hypothetical protein